MNYLPMSSRLIGVKADCYMFEQLKCHWDRFKFGGKLFLITTSSILRNEVTIKKHIA